MVREDQREGHSTDRTKDKLKSISDRNRPDRNPETVKSYNVIKWEFSYWPCYRSEVSHIGQRMAVLARDEVTRRPVRLAEEL